MEFEIVTEKVKGRDVNYLVLKFGVHMVYIGYIDQFGRLHIKSK